ncbi:PP2C-like domain-containing protein C3orf48-like [Cricetulus griseus]|uniref:PP2C-like domain-containing protein C3orf48-like n=1 Tax=Cricetulus griseus TaxID=10029 RepID=G3H8L5_CRIGR|nr:PP2C-like domain-containing protein C3orf48-like [Cricetulus griseus]
MNYAFELLWKKQVPSNFRLCDKVGQTSTHSPKICHLLIKGVAICGNSNSTWKADPNGKFTVTNAFGDKANVCFFGLFDGHHGDAAADLASKEFQVLLLHQLAKQDPSYHMTAEQQKLINSFHTVFKEEYRAREDAFNSTIKTFRTNRREYEEIHKAFAKAFWRMDRLLRLGRNEVSRVRWSGCSALTCVLEGVIKNPNISKDWAKTDPSQRNQQVISGVLHIANADDLCQFLILATNGLWEVLDKKEVTALVITLFHAYKEMCSGPENKSRPSKEPFSLSDSNIRVLFQYKPEYEEDVSTTNLTKRSSDSVFSQACINQAKNAETFPPEMTNYDTHSKKETNSPRTIDSKTGSEKELYAKNFYEGAAEYIGHELVRAALEGGSRESITVMVVFLNGSEYQLLT